MSPPIGLSRKRAKDLLRFHAVRVARLTDVRHDSQLEASDIVTIAAFKQSPDASLERHGIRIVYIDQAIVVIDKPAGLLAIGSEREKERTAHRLVNEHLKAINNARAQQAFIVHRLDRETSGLMVLARSEAVQAALQQNWKDVTKKYLAIVEGAPANPNGTLKDQLKESKSFRVHLVDKGGDLAITHYRVIRSDGERSLLEVTLETGRKHQIRVQLAAAGHPIVGDEKYGGKAKLERHLGLHACAIDLHHPVSGLPMEFKSAPPGRFNALIEGRPARQSSSGKEPVLRVRRVKAIALPAKP
jgi:RluA family pseudouridine synthase